MKIKTKEIHNSIMKIGAAILALAVASGASTPAITSFTQAQPVTKTKKKAKAKKKTKAKKTKSKKKKSYKAKAGTISLSPITLTKGKSKTVSVKTKSKVKWTSSNAKVATVKSISKSKVKVTAKKEGSTKVSGKAGSTKWSFTVKVNGKKPIVKPTGKDTKNKTNKTNTVKKKTNTSQKKANLTIVTGIKSGDTIEFDEPGVSDGTTDVTVYVNNNSVSEKDIKFSLSNTDVLHIKPVFTGDGIAECELIPDKEGTSTFTITAPGYSKSYKLNVNGSAAYEKAKGFIAKVNASGLDDAHKAFVTAKWLEKLVTYGEPEKYTGYEATIIEGKGVCGDYARTYEWLLKLENIKSRYISTGEIGHHGWNQICVNGKWYNVDVTFCDARDDAEIYDNACFMKSDTFTVHHNTPEYAKYGMYGDPDVMIFNDKAHAVKYRSGNGEYPVTATATDYDNYDWSSFAQSEQFKSLIS